MPFICGQNQFPESSQHMNELSGDTLAKYNSYFNEMTGMYWLAKNYQLPDFVGISHYRRLLNLTDETLSKLDNNKILIFEGNGQVPCNYHWNWQESGRFKNWRLIPELKIMRYDNRDIYPQNIFEMIDSNIKGGSKGVCYKYLAILPKQCFIDMIRFFEPILRKYISVIESGKYQNVWREFGFVLEYLYSHFITTYSRMFSYDIDYANKINWLP